MSVASTCICAAAGPAIPKNAATLALIIKEAVLFAISIPQKKSGQTLMPSPLAGEGAAKRRKGGASPRRPFDKAAQKSGVLATGMDAPGMNCSEMGLSG